MLGQICSNIKMTNYKSGDIFEICGCSSFNIKDMEKQAPSAFLGKLKDCLEFHNDYAKVIKDLPDDSDAKDVQLCLDFLSLAHSEPDENLSFYPKKDQSGFHKSKYITIWSFIYGYLGIEKDGSYDYLLMNYLNNMDYMEHGSGIRCGWATEEIRNRQVNKINRLKILDWAKVCDDDGYLPYKANRDI